MIRKMAVLAVSCAALVIAGCGGSEPTFTPESVADMMNENARANLAREFPDATMDPLECVRDGDDTHFRCITRVRQGDEVLPVSAIVVCDEETGRCLSTPT